MIKHKKSRKRSVGIVDRLKCGKEKLWFVYDPPSLLFNRFWKLYP
jgi:hypothetical protein